MITVEVALLREGAIVEKIKDVEFLTLPRPGEHILLMGHKEDRTVEIHKILHIPNSKYMSANVTILGYVRSRFDKDFEV